MSGIRKLLQIDLQKSKTKGKGFSQQQADALSPAAFDRKANEIKGGKRKGNKI